MAGILTTAGTFAETAGTESVELSPVFVTATRTEEPVQHVPFSHQTLTGDAIRLSPNATIDGRLRQTPGFSLFRRSDSLVANPTTQGVSLRGLGPSGASRSLILLDGVPLNDPFGGWVLWSKVPRESLARIELVPGAGGTAWGNAALGGVIQLFTEPPVGSHQRLVVRAGRFNTLDIEAQFTEPVGTGTLQLLSRALSTDGYRTVAPENRGPIDVPASSRSRWVTARWRQPLTENITATITVRRFGEHRGNGTPYQRNSSDESFGSVAIDAQPSGAFRWNATAYAQDQDFASTFSAVNAARTAETLASNQFAVPATAAGLAWVGEWTGTAGKADQSTVFGFDLRDVRGETREDSAFVDSAFTRRRFAGGRQSTAGLFVLHHHSLPADARASLGFRADGWQDTDGHRRDFLNGAPAGDVSYRRREGIELSPSVGIVWPVKSNLMGYSLPQADEEESNPLGYSSRGAADGPVRWHASAQQAFRRPTLNELYRPFRVGNVITDANPELRTETVTSGEIGVAAHHGSVSAGVTGFWNELRDAVANVTLASGPVTLPGIGFVPAGGEARRRYNLDRARVRGLAVEARWDVAESLSLDAHYLYNDARVTRASIAPWLDGRRLAQVPRQSVSVGATWKRGRWSFSPRVRWIGTQFEDDNNRLRLAGAMIVDAVAGVTLMHGGELFVSAENLLDHRIETGRDATGLVNIGMPRLVLVGFRFFR